jgi:hydrogenase large subunit
MVGGATAAQLVANYVEALAIRRKTHQMGAVFGGRMPCSSAFVPGGCADQVTTTKISTFRSLLSEVTTFINTKLVADSATLYNLAALQPYKTIGRGCGNLLAYGVFDLDTAGTSKLLRRGRYTDNAVNTSSTAVVSTQILEHVGYSRYSSASKLNPASGATTPWFDKPNAYSWIKAPRYAGKVHEVGPLARMWVNGDYRKGISVLDRIYARALEAQKIANAMSGWLGQLTAGGATQTARNVPASGTGIGWTEAPRGAVGHWLTISNSLINQYQVLSPTGWNASPKDDGGVAGPIEQALVGTPVKDVNSPIELLRVVHSFDPCLACSVHLARPGEKARKFVVIR